MIMFLHDTMEMHNGVRGGGGQERLSGQSSLEKDRYGFRYERYRLKHIVLTSDHHFITLMPDQNARVAVIHQVHITQHSFHKFFCLENDSFYFILYF